MSRNRSFLPSMRFCPPDNITEHAIYQYDLVIKWIKNLCPELLESSPCNTASWDLIVDYLNQPQLPALTVLTSSLSEELAMCLHGLKVVLLEHGNNWNNAMHCFTEYQKLLPPNMELQPSYQEVPL